MTILIFFLVVGLLITTALLSFTVGQAVQAATIIKELRSRGWTIEPSKMEGVDK